MRVNLIGIHTVRGKLADGSPKTYHYAWRGGPRLDGEPGSPDFVAGYNAAIATRKVAPAGTFHGVVATYKGSQEFLRLAPVTRKDYLRHIKVIEAKFGTMPKAFFTEANKRQARGVFKKWRDELAQRSLRQADYGWTVLARICSVGVDRGEIDANPCEKGGRLYEADRTENIWTLDHETTFIEKAPQHMHLALMLALWTGQRQGDLLKLTWSNYDGVAIRRRQGKGRRRVVIPCGEPLRLALDLERKRKRGALMLLTKEGSPWTADGFRSSWAKACDKAAIVDLTFHDLRGSAVTRLALAGATVPEIASITGHSLKDVEAILDAHYLGRDIGLAESAIRKLEDAYRARARTQAA